MKNGFTLVEVLVALTIIATITIVVMQIYMTITKVEVEAEEEDYARITIQNIHSAFFSDPESWEEVLYASYDVNAPSEFDSMLRFDANWQLLEATETAVYTIDYDYGETYDDEADRTVYDLSIDEIASEQRVIFSNIDLGKMVSP
ncbi:MAG: type II secretion system protein [Acholeplasmataceae bacterium]